MIDVNSITVYQSLITAKSLIADGRIRLRQKVDFINKMSDRDPSKLGRKDIADIIKVIRPFKIVTYYVYMVSDGDFVKIGVTSNIKKRINSIGVGNPRKLTLLDLDRVGSNKDGAYKKEAFMHDKFKQHNVRGEWFSKAAIEEFLKTQNKKEK